MKSLVCPWQHCKVQSLVLALALRLKSLLTSLLVAEDMLDRRYFPYLETAITILSRNADEQADLKAGTKLGLGYIVKKVMKVEYLITSHDKACSMDNTVTVLELQSPLLFSDAQYEVTNVRQECLCKAAELPVEEDIAIVRQYMLEVIPQMPTRNICSGPPQNSVCCKILLPAQRCSMLGMAENPADYSWVNGRMQNVMFGYQTPVSVWCKIQPNKCWSENSWPRTRLAKGSNIWSLC